MYKNPNKKPKNEDIISLCCHFVDVKCSLEPDRVTVFSTKHADKYTIPTRIDSLRFRREIDVNKTLQIVIMT